MMYEKMLVFDMDGTLADLYEVDNWLDYLRNYDPTPYAIAEPMYDMEELVLILSMLKKIGWRIAVTSWLSKETTKDYDKEVRKTKKAWLDQFNFPYDETHFVKYGTFKPDCTRKKAWNQILIDDNKEVLDSWTLGETINAKGDIKRALLELLAKEILEHGEKA